MENVQKKSKLFKLQFKNEHQLVEFISTIINIIS